FASWRSVAMLRQGTLRLPLRSRSLVHAVRLSQRLTWLVIADRWACIPRRPSLMTPHSVMLSWCGNKEPCQRDFSGTSTVVEGTTRRCQYMTSQIAMKPVDGLAWLAHISTGTKLSNRGGCLC